MLGLASSTATRISPKARIAAYKVCWPGGCFTSYILTGMDGAVADGVNIISISIGTRDGVEYNVDPIATPLQLALSGRWSFERMKT